MRIKKKIETQNKGRLEVQDKLSSVATIYDCTGSKVPGPLHHEGTGSFGESQRIKYELFELDAVVAGRFDRDTILVCHRNLLVRHMKTTSQRNIHDDRTNRNVMMNELEQIRCR